MQAVQLIKDRHPCTQSHTYTMQNIRYSHCISYRQPCITSQCLKHSDHFSVKCHTAISHICNIARLNEDTQEIKQDVHYTTLLEDAGTNVDWLSKSVGQDLAPPAVNVVPPAAKSVSTSHCFE